MKTEKSALKDVYYTMDHEWIDFQGSVAYVGVCKFKLSGFKEVEQLNFSGAQGFRQRGEPIVTLRYRDFQIDVNMPVDGKIVETNPNLIYGDGSYLLQHAETDGWIALIIPSQPYDRKGLLIPEKYRMNGKSKYAK